MKRWIDFIMKGSRDRHPALIWFGRVAYYYIILLVLFILYLVQKQHTAAPFIYNNF
ncbi:teichoic acid D-Ala incorporation-associated protein DltX [Desulfosporosinus hippei]|uniref:teichoic acid D-Ala incorporation-associated protein DltX n=1 Tax=Desulfosporosinus hippei TaxID=569859 RepID=UPI000A742122